MTTETTEQAAGSIDELVSVDSIVIEFPEAGFRGEIVPAVDSLVEKEMVRALDQLVMRKDDTGGRGDPQRGPRWRWRSSAPEEERRAFTRHR